MPKVGAWPTTMDCNYILNYNPFSLSLYMNKTCIKCNETKELGEFSKRTINKDGVNNKCKSCVNKYSKDHYNNNKESYIAKARKWNKKQRDIFNNYLIDKQCVDCGEDDSIVLEFDHRSDKLFNVADMVSRYSYDKVQKEINKCDIVCANCHKRRTAKQFSWTKASIVC